jgi:hypothetical protein
LLAIVFLLALEAFHIANAFSLLASTFEPGQRADDIEVLTNWDYGRGRPD